ncbi:MAG: hypothetical protein H6721_34040 [Sandaracinus sp.]|nr:hypothetical protein [Sandaracinus sp.]
MSSRADERGHVTFDAADPEAVVAALRRGETPVAGLPVLDEEGSGLRLPPKPVTALDLALAAAAEAAQLEDLEDLDDDAPTIRGVRPNLTPFPSEAPTVPAGLVRDALLAATRAALADAAPAPTPLLAEDDDLTIRGDRRALEIALRGDHTPVKASPPRPKPRLVPEPVQPPALPVPLVRRADAWIDELPEAARRVLLDAQDAQPSWPLVERTDGAVLRPKQRIPSLRPRR